MTCVVFAGQDQFVLPPALHTFHRRRLGRHEERVVRVRAVDGDIVRGKRERSERGAGRVGGAGRLIRAGADSAQAPAELERRDERRETSRRLGQRLREGSERLMREQLCPVVLLIEIDDAVRLNAHAEARSDRHVSCERFLARRTCRFVTAAARDEANYGQHTCCNGPTRTS